MRQEKSGLAFTTLELVQAEEAAGHQVCLREPTDAKGFPGPILYGADRPPDVEFIHSQMPITSYFGRVPRFLWMHGEPLSSVGNGISMRAIVDMAPKVDAFLAMRPEEAAVWNTIKRTYVVPKGIDLARFRPMDVPPHADDDPTSKLSGSPAILYCEHWRGTRNPLYWCVAMERVWRTLPHARLHLVNCTDKKMFDTFRSLINHNKWGTFIRTLSGPVQDADVVRLYNRADIIVSALYPLYARSLEALACGKALIAPGYTNPAYPWHTPLDPEVMADTILACWGDYDRINYRTWAEDHHDVTQTVDAVFDVVRRYQ